VRCLSEVGLVDCGKQKECILACKAFVSRVCDGVLLGQYCRSQWTAYKHTQRRTMCKYSS